VVLNAIVSIVAILALTVIEYCLLQEGVDSTIALLIVGAISGIAGYNVKEILSYVKGKGKEGK